LANKCVLSIKRQIKTVSSKKKTSPVWIPYGRLLGEALPAIRGSDMRTAHRVFSLLNIVTLSNCQLRKKLLYGEESQVVADPEDLAEVLHLLNQNIGSSSGIPTHKLKFFNEVL